MKSLHKALDVLFALSSSQSSSLALSELSRIVNIDKVIVHRILRTFVERNVVVQDPATKRYRLGDQLIAMAGKRMASFKPLTLARPHLLALWNETQETVHFNVLSQDESTVVQVLDSPQAIRVAGTLGQKAPLHCTASGKIFLAFGTEALRERVLSVPLTRFTEKTVTEKEAVLTILDKVREEKCATDLEEYLPHAGAVAAPVFNRNGHCIAAVAVRAPIVRLDPERTKILAAAAIKTAQTIGEELAHSSFSENGEGAWDFGTQS